MALAALAVAGSSPLARGLLPLRRGRCPSVRIIPARAGFTGRWERTSRRGGDHPRSRGVYSLRSSGGRSSRGSSPLARGLPQRLRRRVAAGGIIPARAGFTPFQGGRSSGLRDHPRSRGVYGSVRPSRTMSAGSSPLARGLPGAQGGRSVSRGIIPARAGFTPLAGWVGARDSDHPRSRGVYRNDFDVELPQVGSSPLARGLLVVDAVLNVVGRIIPARAGFTLNLSLSGTRLRDHPRSRGVYVALILSAVTWVGSSPLARGLRETNNPFAGDDGIIPARAGFTNVKGTRNSRGQDHPRSRGVYP